MKTLLFSLLLAGSLIADETFTSPGASCFGPKGLVYTTDTGRILMIEGGKLKVFATGLDTPTGIVFFKAQNAFYVVDGERVRKLDAKGKVSEVPGAFSKLRSIALDDFSQALLVVDANGLHRIDFKNKGATEPILKGDFTAVAFDGHVHAILSDGKTLSRVSFADKTITKFAEGFDGVKCITWDRNGRLFIVDAKGISGIPKPGVAPVIVKENKNIRAAMIDSTGTRLVVTKNSGTDSESAEIPGWEVNTDDIKVDLVPAFPKLAWTGWDDGSDVGKVNEHRPVFLTNAGDGSNRVFVVLQQGTIHVFENDANATKTKVFLDITKKVRFLKNQNEEGLLGLAFHPDYKKNGEFFVYYTDVASKGTNIVSRFKVKADDANAAEPNSEEVLLRIEKPYWNHDGGTIAFGPDGYLYITHGDGGLGNDPHENGQSLKTHLGKILRIDVNKKADGKNYAIPADNPFVSTPDAKPEIYAYGIRNVWRFAFDRKTGNLWAGEVGQNLFEEINIIEKGGNYGWSVRESFHPFGKKGVDASKSISDPIWEYNHEVGKSITGGHVYRGKAIPELQGLYLYADYVTPKMWALRYDEAKKRVTGNHELGVPGIAVMSFGEDEKGESYIMGASTTGKGIFKITKRN